MTLSSSERQTSVGEYNWIRPRRRNNSQSNHNAIAAAEAAAASILSNGPIIKKKKDKGSPTSTTMSTSTSMASRGGGGESNYSVIRSRSFSSSNNDLSSTNGNNNKIHNNDNSNNSVSNNNSNNIRGSSFILKMQRQREFILQKGRRRRQSLGGGFYHGSSSSSSRTTALLSSKKVIMIIIFFMLGILFIYEEEGYQYHQDQTNVNHNSNSNKQMLTAKKNKVKDSSSNNNVSIERRKGFVATFVRGSHPHDNDEQQHSSSSDEEVEVVVVKSPIVEASSSNNAVAITVASAVVDNNEENNVENVDDDAIIKQPGNHNHIIPSTLIFTYHTNLLTTPASELNDEEDVALSYNVKQIISLHNNDNNSTSSSTNNNKYNNVRFLNDDDCIKSIKYALGPDTNLTTYFTNEEHGMYKADICRGAALYESGGLYFDIDIEARMSIWNVISHQTEFVTTFVHKDSNHLGGFFQAFIGVIPHSTIMKRYLELFVLYYEGELNVNGPLGVYFLRMAYDAIIGKTHNENDGTIDLWQEVRYTPQRFPYVTRDRWGERRACQMLVVAKSIKVEGFEREEMVPLFSHANGSRMCGGKDTYKKG